MNGPQGSTTITKGCNTSWDKRTLGNPERKVKRRQKGEMEFLQERPKHHGHGHYDGRKTRTMHEKWTMF